MAYIVVIKSAGLPIDMVYMLNEPEAAKTLKEYLKGNNCTANLLPCSENADKAKHILQSQFLLTKVNVPNLVKPTKPMSIIETLEHLITKDIIATRSLSPEHARQLKRTPIAPAAQEPIDWDDMDGLLDTDLDTIAQLEETKRSLETAMESNPLLKMMNDVLKKINDQNRTIVNIDVTLRAVAIKVTRLEEISKRNEAAINVLVSKLGNKPVWCGYCKSNSHPFTECKSKTICRICFQDNHKQVVCPLSGVACSECEKDDHSSVAHFVSDNTIRCLVRDLHGSDFKFM